MRTDQHPTRTSRWLRSVRQAAGWHRRLLAAGLAAGAVAAALHALAPPEAATQQVLVATDALAAGTAVTLDVLDTRAVPPDLVPDQALLPGADLTGAVLAGPLGAGEMVTELRLAGPGLLRSVGPGLVGAPVRLADAAATAVVAPGDVVDVLAAGSPDTMTGLATRQPARAVATGARVVALLPDPSLGAAAPFSGAGADTTGAVLLLAVTPATAAELAGAAVDARLSVTLRPEATGP